MVTKEAMILTSIVEGMFVLSPMITPDICLFGFGLKLNALFVIKLAQP